MTKITDAALKKLGFSRQLSESDGPYVRFEIWQHNSGCELIWYGDYWSFKEDAVDDVEDLKNRMRGNPCD